MLWGAKYTLIAY